MKRVILSAVLGAALIVTPAYANHGENHGKKPTAKKNPSSKGRCGVVWKGFVVTGNNAVFAVTKNTDGTYDGTVELTATKTNYHAKKSGVNAEDTATETFTLDDTKIVFGPDVADGGDDGTDVGPGDVVETDTVKLIGKIAYAKKGSKKNPCSDRGYGSDRYGDYKIRKATVNRAPTA